VVRIVGPNDVQTPDISAVIVHYETPEWLDRCLAALARAQGDFSLEIIVVDNASRNFDGSHIVASHPTLSLISNATNRGFAAANNQGLRAARGRYLLLVNPDTLVEADTLVTMLAQMDSDPRVGCATPELVLPNGAIDPACRRMFPTPGRAFFRLTMLSRIFPRSRLFAQYNLSYLDQRVDAEIDSPCGAFMMVRRETFDQVGFLDERYFMYGEDLDWAFRMKQTGWRIVYTARTSARHEKRASSRLNKTKAIHDFHDAMRIFYDDHYARQHSRPVSWLVHRAIDGRQLVELSAERVRGVRRTRRLSVHGQGASS
jgi:GT2 family glycosyltransferase